MCKQQILAKIAVECTKDVLPKIVVGKNGDPDAWDCTGGGGVAPAKPLRSYQCSKSTLGSLGSSSRFSRDSSVSLYSIPGQ